VVACSGRQGITVDMPLAEARGLVPAAYFEQHDPRADRAALEQLACRSEQFSPLVGIDGGDTLLLDVTGLAALFGSEASLVQQLMRAFHRWGFVVRAALADTLGAAWALARFGPPSLALRANMLARRASEGGEAEAGSHFSPVIVPPGQTARALADLPIAALRLEAEVEILAELGIQRIGQLLGLPREALAARFDPRLLLRLDQATGAVSEIIVPHRPPPDIAAGIELEYPTEDRQAVDAILGQLMERISRALVARQQGAIQLECRLKHEGGETIQFVVGLFRASAQAKHLLELTQMQLDRTALVGLKKGTGSERRSAAAPLDALPRGARPLFQPGPVTAVRLSVLAAAPLQAWQPELFEPSKRESRRQVAQLVDRLSNRLGREAVVRALPQPDAQPEFAFRYEPLAGVVPRKAVPRKGSGSFSSRSGKNLRTNRKPENVPDPLSSPSGKNGRGLSPFAESAEQKGTVPLASPLASPKNSRWKLLPRPLRLETEPIRLEVLSVVPEGPPIQFDLHGIHRVAQAWGPERIQTGWWRGRYVQRDYYRIETAAGLRFWLFRRLSDDQWFLHGAFD
jgi:protein ImuB